MSDIFGARIYISDRAAQTHTKWVTVRNPIEKRRRRWRLLREVETRPCAYQTPYGLYVHPAIYDELIHKLAR